MALDIGSLPENVYDVIEILRSEAAPRETWTRVARLYSSASRLSDCTRILEDAVGNPLHHPKTSACRIVKACANQEL